MIYKKTIKPFFDYSIALICILLFSPLLIITTVLLFIANHGKPFFFQYRPGKNEKLFKIIKFNINTINI